MSFDGSRSRVCLCCGVSFYNTRRGVIKYCGVSCQDAAMRKRDKQRRLAIIADNPKPCAHCGGEVPINFGSGPQGKFCSKFCRNRGYYKTRLVEVRKCQHCGGSFNYGEKGKTSRQKFCRDECAFNFHRGRLKKTSKRMGVHTYDAKKRRRERVASDPVFKKREAARSRRRLENPAHREKMRLLGAQHHLKRSLLSAVARMARAETLEAIAERKRARTKEQNRRGNELHYVRYHTDPAYRRKCIEASKLYYRTVIKPRKEKK